MKCIYSKLSNMMELSEQREKSKVEDFPFHATLCNCSGFSIIHVL